MDVPPPLLPVGLGVWTEERVDAEQQICEFISDCRDETAVQSRAASFKSLLFSEHSDFS